MSAQDYSTRLAIFENEVAQCKNLLKAEFGVEKFGTDPILVPSLKALIAEFKEVHPMYSHVKGNIYALRDLLERPEIHNFLEGVKLEAAHQIKRWGVDDDRSKGPEQWYWLVGFLAGKALQAQRLGDDGKFMHHLISTAAVLSNWHYFASNPDPQEWEKKL